MIKILHYCTGVTLSVFIGMHVLNHLLILRSEALHMRFMRAARVVYRQPVVEGLLLLVVLLQILSGLYLVTRKWSTADGVFDWLQIGSGLYLSLFLVNHVRAVITGRYKLQMDTNLYYGAGVMNVWPQKLFFIPYYALAIISFFTHVASIHRIKMQAFVPLAEAERQSMGIIATGIVLTILIVGRMANIKMPAGYAAGEGRDRG